MSQETIVGCRTSFYELSEVVLKITLNVSLNFEVLRRWLTDVLLNDIPGLRCTDRRVYYRNDLFYVVHQHNSSPATFVSRLNNPNV